MANRDRLRAILNGPRIFLRELGDGIKRGWQAVGGRLRRHPGRDGSTGLSIRKVTIERKYSHDRTPTRLLQADLANTVAVTVGVAAVPLLWHRLGFYWAISLVAGTLPLLVAYRRRHQATARPGRQSWDVLTVAGLLIGVLVAASALAAAVMAFTTDRAGAQFWPALAVGYLALPVWMVGEAGNAYARLIRRPRPGRAVASLAKSLLQAVGALFTLLYLILAVNVSCLGPICIEPISAAALLWVGLAAFAVALLLQGALVLAGRLGRRVPGRAAPST